MTQTEWTLRMIELGYFDFFGLGTDIRAAESAIDAALRIDELARKETGYDDHESGKPVP